MFALLVLGSGPAHGFYDTPVIDPPHPTAGQLIGFSVRVGVCDFLFAPPIAGDEWRDLVVVGNTLKVTVTAFDGNFNEDFCIYPTGTGRFSLIRLDAGTYQLELYRRDTADLNNIRLATRTSFVVGVGPAAIPVVGHIGQSLLGLTLLALGLAAQQAHRIRT